MTDYTITTNFGAKDSLPSGNAGKVIKGSEFTTEFTNIQTAVATKANIVSPTFTGAVTFDAAVTVNSTATITGDLAVDTNTLFVDVSENKVGIGTDSPDYALDVDGTIASRDAYLITANSSGTPSAGAFMFRPASNTLALGTNSTERMRIDSLGNVGIGTNNPQRKLHVQDGDIRIESTYPRLYLTDTDHNSDYSIINSNGSFLIYDDTNASNRMVIDSSGNVGIGTTTVGQFASTNVGLTVDSGNDYSGIAMTDGSTTSTLAQGFSTTYLYNQANGSMLFGTNNTERMRIAANGNVGIGTTSPDSILDVVGADPILTIRDTSTSGSDSHATLRLAESGASDSLNLHYDISLDEGHLTFNYDNNGSNATERMRIDSSGRVGIGTSSPYVKTEITGGDLAVGGGAGASNLGFEIKGVPLSAIPSAQARGYVATADSGMGTAGDLLIAPRTNANASVRFITGTSPTERMRIDSSGNLLVDTTSTGATGGGFSFRAGSVNYMNIAHASSVGHGNYFAAFKHNDTVIGTITKTNTTGVSYNTSSDERLKENITDSADAGSKVDAIQIRQYDWKADGTHQDYGVIAQELVEVAPEAVHQPVDEEDMMGVDYSKLVPMLIKEVQSLRSRVAELENV